MGKAKDAAKQEVLAIGDVAELLMVTDRTIRNWLTEKDMPSISDERGRRFVWADVLPWYVKMRAEEDGNARKRMDAEDEFGEQVDLRTKLERATLRRTVAQADLSELDLATRRAEVVAVADVARTLQDVAKNLQTEILAWPTLMIGRIFGMRDRNQLFNTLTVSARELCTRLAGLDPTPAAAEDA